MDPKKILKNRMDQALENLSAFLDNRGMHPSVLGEAMDAFTRSLFDLPEGVACKSGCADCCHLRVGVSIPEAVVIFNELTSRATPEGLTFLKQKVIRTAQNGNPLDETWWLTSRTACPFLDTQGPNLCLIYPLRPFSCRAYHSLDRSACREGFERGRETQIPCFPLYRAFTDMYSTVFIRMMAQKGLFSHQVGFVRALQILFEDDTAIERWFRGEDVFRTARLA